MHSIEKRLEQIETLLAMLVQRETAKEWYSTEEFARLVGRAEATVRGWFQRGRVIATKRRSGRGAYPAWAISHQSLRRYQREGLLPAAASGSHSAPVRYLKP